MWGVTVNVWQLGCGSVEYMIWECVGCEVLGYVGLWVSGHWCDLWGCIGVCMEMREECILY